jgi:hypothetical protein
MDVRRPTSGESRDRRVFSPSAALSQTTHITPTQWSAGGTGVHGGRACDALNSAAEPVVVASQARELELSTEGCIDHEEANDAPC